MERLTKRAEDGHVYTCRLNQEVLRKLADYEDLEEQGKLLRLPVGIGETVWVVASYSGIIHECKIGSVLIMGQSIMYSYEIQCKKRSVGGCFLSSDIGKTVFLTREAALKERGV